jgi:hypothetical protein
MGVVEGKGVVESKEGEGGENKGEGDDGEGVERSSPVCLMKF